MDLFVRKRCFILHQFQYKLSVSMFLGTPVEILANISFDTRPSSRTLFVSDGDVR